MIQAFDERKSPPNRHAGTSGGRVCVCVYLHMCVCVCVCVCNTSSVSQDTDRYEMPSFSIYLSIYLSISKHILLLLSLFSWLFLLLILLLILLLFDKWEERFHYLHLFLLIGRKGKGRTAKILLPRTVLPSPSLSRIEKHFMYHVPAAHAHAHTHVYVSLSEPTPMCACIHPTRQWKQINNNDKQ